MKIIIKELFRDRFNLLYCVLSLGILISCDEIDNEGEYKLTGNIEHLIPVSSYDVKKTESSDGKYIIFTPELNRNFEYWGLSMKKADYYLDGNLYKTVTDVPFELMLVKNDIDVGNHTILTKMTIGGEACNDAVIEKSNDFTLSSHGDISESYGDFYIDYNYVTKGEYLIVTPELLTERSSKGCKIKEVEYKWDGQVIQKSTTAPFSLKYMVNDEIGTTHNLSVYISYQDDNNLYLSYNWGYSDYKIRGDNDYMYSWSIKSKQNMYSNGETVSCAAKIYKGKNFNGTISWELFLDGVSVAQTDKFPYVKDIILSGMSIGTHVLKGKFTIRQGNGSSSSSEEKTIIITK